MIPRRIKYNLPINIVMLAAVLFCSFSYRHNPTSIPETGIVPVYNLLSLPIPESYSPEFIQNADSVTIPMKRAGRLFLIEANVDGEDGNLVFDTGAIGLVLNSTYFRNHVKTGGANPTGITGTVGTIEQISVSKIEFAGLVYNNLRADIVNLGHIENRRGVKILGLIGFSILRDLEIIIDPIKNELKLFRIDKKGNRLNSHTSVFKPDYTQKIEGNTHILFLRGAIGGKPLNFCFDTGAETNAVSSYSNKKVLSTLSITRRTALKGAGSAGSEVLFGRMNDFTFGNRQIQNMETVITNLDALCEAYGTHIDGILGYSFLENGIICVNFVNRQFGIRFTKGDEK